MYWRHQKSWFACYDGTHMAASATPLAALPPIQGLGNFPFHAGCHGRPHSTPSSFIACKQNRTALACTTSTWLVADVGPLADPAAYENIFSLTLLLRVSWFLWDACADTFVSAAWPAATAQPILRTALRTCLFVQSCCMPCLPPACLSRINYCMLLWCLN